MSIYRAITLTVATASLFFLGIANAADDLPAAATADVSAAPDPNQAAAAAPAATADDDKVHIVNTGYLWIPGVHGDYSSSLLGYNLGYKASPSDLAGKADFGFMNLAALQYHRLIVLNDFYVAPFSTTTRTIFPQLPGPNPITSISAKFTYTQVELALETGYRIYNGQKLKIDGLGGFRYWHNGYGATVTLNGVQNPHRSISTNYTDPVVGGRIGYRLSEKMTANIWGDVGGWGSGSQLEYQLIGALTYDIKPKWAIDIAWRYNWLDYKNGPFLSNTWAYSGIVIGLSHRIDIGK